jgi:hypothetical protein
VTVEGDVPRPSVPSGGGGEAGPTVPAHPVALRHPDRVSAWVIAMVGRAAPGSRVLDPAVLDSRLSQLATSSPMIAGRLRGGQWQAAEPPAIEVVGSLEDPIPILPLHHFDLATEAPLRILVGADGSWISLCAHHFAFDGLAMVSILRSLVTGRSEEVSVIGWNSRVSSPEVPWPVLKRVLLPADPVASTGSVSGTEVLEARTVHLSGKRITSKLSAACTRAVIAHNQRRRKPMRRIGISVAVGGVDGQSATYRRIDVRPGDPVGELVERALGTPKVPRELMALPRAASLMSPIVGRLSDTILVSNLGRRELGAIERLDFFPVARGRSAVAFGLTGIPGGQTSLSLRTRNLDPADTRNILDDAAEQFELELRA